MIDPKTISQTLRQAAARAYEENDTSPTLLALADALAIEGEPRVGDRVFCTDARIEEEGIVIKVAYSEWALVRLFKAAGGDTEFEVGFEELRIIARAGYSEALK